MSVSLAIIDDDHLPHPTNNTNNTAYTATTTTIDCLETSLSPQTTSLRFENVSDKQCHQPVRETEPTNRHMVWRQ